MTFDRGLALLNFATMAVAGFLLWSVRSAFKSGRWLAKVEEHVLKNSERIEGVEERMDKAGEQTSKLATIIQGLPERFREIFVTQREFDKYTEESRADRRDLWSALNRRRVDR